MPSVSPGPRYGAPSPTCGTRPSSGRCPAGEATSPSASLERHARGGRSRAMPAASRSRVQLLDVGQVEPDDVAGGAGVGGVCQEPDPLAGTYGAEALGHDIDGAEGVSR